MLNTYREIEESAKMLRAREKEGAADSFYEDLKELSRKGEINRHSMSMHALFEEFVDDGRNIMRRIVRDKDSHVLLEAGAGAVDTSRFSKIIGQISFGQAMERFEAPDMIINNVTTTIPATTKLAESMGGATNIGDQAAETGEGEAYPVVGFGPQFITTPAKVKEGFALAITEEMFREDKTGQIQEVLDSAIDQLAISKEKDGLNTVLGITTSYSRNGGASQATYADTHTEGDFDNLLASNALTNHESIQNANRVLEAIDDLDTGEPIPVPATRTIVCPPALADTADLIQAPAQIKLAADSASVQPIVLNPMGRRNRNFDIQSNDYVRRLYTANDTTWWYGDFKAAFVYLEYFPLQDHTIDGTNHPLRVTNDIITVLRVRRSGAFGVRRPWRVMRCDA